MPTMQQARNQGKWAVLRFVAYSGAIFGIGLLTGIQRERATAWPKHHAELLECGFTQMREDQKDFNREVEQCYQIINEKLKHLPPGIEIRR
jgi:hypothetical protein